MQFKIEETNGIRHNNEYYPTFRIQISGDHIASEIDDIPMTGKEVEGIIFSCEREISQHISDIITKAVYSRYSNRIETKTGKIVRAEVYHCTWCGDEIFEGESDYIADCSAILDKFDFDKLPKPEDASQCASEGFFDCVYEDGVVYGICEEWSGPYNVYIDECDYERYYEARKVVEG